MSWNTNTCPHHGTYEFYGRYVPPCPRCGYPELKTAEEYYRSMGIKTVDKTVTECHNGDTVNKGA